MAREYNKDHGKSYNKDYNKDYDSKDYGRKNDYMDDDGDYGDGKKRRFSSGARKRPCRFLTGEEDINNLSYKNPKFLATFLTEHGKIVPRRVTGNSALAQRILTAEIKRARVLGLLGYTNIGPNAG